MVCGGRRGAPSARILDALRAGIVVLIAVAAWSAPVAAQSLPSSALVSTPPASELERRVDEAFIATFPMFEMARARFNTVVNPLNPSPRPPNGPPVNRRALLDHTAREVTAPNNDTLYSGVWLDLHATPVRFHVPTVDGNRYWSIQLLDAWMENVGVFSRRTDGDGPLDVVVVGPSWHGWRPSGRVIRSPSNDVLFIGRFLVSSAADAPTVHRLQDGLRIGPVDAEAPVLPQWVPVSTAADPANFLAVVNEFLARNPVPAGERERWRGWRDLGIGGGPDAYLRTSPQVQAAWRRRLPALHEGLKVGLRYESRTVGGWAVPSPRVGDYRGDEPLRAAVALGAFGALPGREALYLTLEADPDGVPLTGAKRWKLLVPPIDARGFWSLSMYEKDGDGRLFFTDNPLRRYSIGDRTEGLRRGGGGAMELIVQHEAPADTSNWLPAPAGAYVLMLRAYLPSEAFLRGEAPLPRLVPAD